MRNKIIIILEAVLITICFSTPILLVYLNDEVLSSISSYAYSKNNLYYYILLSFCSFSYIINAILFKNKTDYVLSILLIGVILTPYKEYQLSHNIIAFTFFTLNCYNLAYNVRTYKKFNRIICIIATIILLSSVLFDKYIFYAETICIFLINGFYLVNKIRNNFFQKSNNKNNTK